MIVTEVVMVLTMIVTDGGGFDDDCHSKWFNIQSQHLVSVLCIFRVPIKRKLMDIRKILAISP